MEGSILILHDGDCREFETDHVPGAEINPPAWVNIRSGDAVEIPAEHPITGWRYILITSYEKTVVQFGEYFDSGVFEGLMHAEKASCNWTPLSAHLKDTVQPWNHTPHSPDPDCQCGYRIVHDVTDLTMMLRQQQELQPLSAVVPVDEMPWLPWAAAGAESGDYGRIDVGVISVVGCGNAATCEFKTYRDPRDTLRVETLAGTPDVIVSESAPLDTFREFGMVPIPVSDLMRVHDPGRCGESDEKYELIRMLPDFFEVSDGNAQLCASESRRGDSGFTFYGRWGAHGAAGVALVRDGRVLLVRQSGGHGWQLPGGARHLDETPGQAATRETLEETGLNVIGAEVHGAFAASDVGGWTYTTIVADCPVGEPVARGEVDEVGWFDLPPEGTHPDLVDSWPRLASLIG